MYELSSDQKSEGQKQPRRKTAYEFAPDRAVAFVIVCILLVIIGAMGVEIQRLRGH